MEKHPLLYNPDDGFAAFLYPFALKLHLWSAHVASDVEPDDVVYLYLGVGLNMLFYGLLTYFFGWSKALLTGLGVTSLYYGLRIF